MAEKPVAGLDFTRALTQDLVAHQNVRQELVITTVDKLKLCLIDHRDKLLAQREWSAPAALFVGVTATLVAADFKSAFGLSADTWRALFLVLAVMSGAAAVWLVIRALAFRTEASLEHVIDTIAARSSLIPDFKALAAMLGDTIITTDYGLGRALPKKD